jgi:hypothetical protein
MIPEREQDWQRRLGRLRLGAEPLDEQLARIRRVTWTLTVLTLLIGLGIFGLFAAFREPRIGLIVASLLAAPIVVLAWREDLRLVRLVARYERERS